MGKGSNVQKATAARERNQKKLGKSVEERKAASAKATKDSSAFVCLICKQSFMVNAKPPVLFLHVSSKHDAGTDPASCFPCLKGIDPEDPNKEKVKIAKRVAAPKTKSKKVKDDMLDGLLDAGLSKGKKKKK